jgi:hypothetical protein
MIDIVKLDNIFLEKKTLFGRNGTGTFQPEFWQNLWNGLRF